MARKANIAGVVGLVFGLAVIPSMIWAQTATLLPNAKQQYVDDAGVPVASGTVDYYVPGTSTRKTIWQDSAETIPQANPVTLDAAGRPEPDGQTYGEGCYRQVVKDQDALTIWDAVTCSTGSASSGTAVAYSEGVMVGTIIPWANTTLPSKYLYTAGQAIDRTTYSDLFTAITYSTNILCTSGIATISVSTTISDSVPIGAPLEATCFAPGATVIAKSSGQLTMSSNATATSSVTAVIFPWGNGDGSTTFNVPDLRGRVLAGRNNMSGSAGTALTSTYYTTPAGSAVNPNAINAVAGSESRTLVTANLPPYTPAGTIVSTPSVSGVNTGNAGPAAAGSVGVVPSTISTLTVASTFTGTAQGGVSTPVSAVQPSITTDYIIKALPDDSPTGPGVTSIQGMTGAISCGANVTCTANTISVSSSILTVTIGTTPIASGTANGILYVNGAVFGNTNSANSSVLVTSGVGVPSLSPTLPDGLAMGTPASITLTNGAGLPIPGITGLGTGVATALGTNVGIAGAFVTFNGAGGTPSSLTLTNAAGLPIAGITGLGTGVATALGTNVGSAGAFVTFNGAGGTPSSLTLINATGLPIAGITGLGTNVATGLATATGSANGFPRVIAIGTIALGTSAISTATCASAVTATATGTTTTDVIDVGFNGDPTATTGYTAGAMLSIIPYPTANTVNVKVCNNTASTITPSALTLNWRVTR